MKYLAVILLVLAACDAPTPTGTKCPDPDPGTPTWEDFGQDFMTRYCTWCHESSLSRSKRNGAPLFHDYDTLFGVLKTPGHIDEQSGAGPDATNEYMPPDRCPSIIGGSIDKNCAKPTLEERKKLALWIACEVDRPHDFTHAGVDAP